MGQPRCVPQLQLELDWRLFIITGISLRRKTSIDDSNSVQWRTWAHETITLRRLLRYLRRCLLVFTAGQIPATPNGEVGGNAPIKTKIEQCLKNDRIVLQADGPELNYVLKVIMFLNDIDDFDAMNDVYRRTSTPSHQLKVHLKLPTSRGCLHRDRGDSFTRITRCLEDC